MHSAAAVSAILRGTFNDRYDSNDSHDQRAASATVADTYTTSLRARADQASALERLRLHDISRPSSSSGSIGSRSLRHIPRFEDSKTSRLRSTSVESPLRAEPSPVQTREESPPPRSQTTPPKSSYHRRATSAHYSSSTPHPALRISKRTHSAILYALEEALRKPKPFTPDEAEEYALMSDLGGGSAARASNGGARIGGPVPVSGSTPIRTPRDVMRDRNAREARRQEQQKEEEQRRLAEERRRSAERRAATVPGAVPRFSSSSSQYSPDVRAQHGFDDPAAERRQSRVAGEVAGTNVLGEPTGRVSQDASGRDRSQSASRPEPLRPIPAAARRPQTSQAGPRQPALAPTASATAGPSASASLPGAPTVEGAQRNTQSSFPHAFERWETLSSHWEGLTSYWLHKLEQNTEEIKEKVPTASTLARQITDLSAAGANLFHAVVELQRLRASSERKFQRWFFETRADNERNRELQAGMERQLNVERKAREETAQQQAEAASAVENAKREVAEMRRELMISKDEARRAWEELGRRNQESLDTAQSLKEGRITVVSGVQVVPYFGQPSRTGSASQGQRPVTRDGPPAGYASTGFSAGAAGLATPGDDERQYYREEGPSPTNTDPFTESGRQQPSLHHEPGKPSLAQGSYYPQGSSSASQAGIGSAAVSTTLHPAQAREGAPPSGSMTSPERFYQHGGPGTSLHSSQGEPSRPPPAAMAPPRTDTRSQPRSEAESYISTEYELDHTGSFRLDSHGNKIPYVARPPPARSEVRSEARSEDSEDDYDTEQAVRRERELAEQYGGGLVPEAPSVPSTSAAAMAAGYVPTTGPEEPDYEGAGYEDYQQQVPYQMQGRHHHPTRLSDVLEEEEERSSRRTGD